MPLDPDPLNYDGPVGKLRRLGPAALAAAVRVFVDSIPTCGAEWNPYADLFSLRCDDRPNHGGPHRFTDHNGPAGKTAHVWWWEE